jgi:4-hydroxyacetophenone monooxygenase
VSGGTSLPSWYQIWSGYIAQCLIRMIEEGYSQVQVTEDAHDRYNAALDAESKKLVMMTDKASIDKNYYVNEFGRLQVNAAFESPLFHAMSSTPDWNDLQLA